MISVELLVPVLFWLCVSGVLYAYVGYPGVVWACAAAFGRRRVPPRLQGSQRLPFVSVLIVAHNEEECIGARVDNALAVDYPRERLEIVIASDGSTDRTTAIARSRQDPRVRVVEFRTRRG